MTPEEFSKHTILAVSNADTSLAQRLQYEIRDYCSRWHTNSVPKILSDHVERAAKGLVVTLLNDYEHGKRKPRDPELLNIIRTYISNLTDVDHWNLGQYTYVRHGETRVYLNDEVIEKCKESLDQTFSNVVALIERHDRGLPVQGVTRKADVSVGSVWAGYELFVRRNPALAQLTSFLLSTLIAIAALVVSIFSLSQKP